MFSNNYQAGALSFEIFSNDKKLISNSGYYSDKYSKFNRISKSTAVHNSLTIEDYSSCSFAKDQSSLIADNGLCFKKYSF